MLWLPCELDIEASNEFEDMHEGQKIQTGGLSAAEDGILSKIKP